MTERDVSCKQCHQYTLVNFVLKFPMFFLAVPYGFLIEVSPGFVRVCLMVFVLEVPHGFVGLCITISC